MSHGDDLEPEVLPPHHELAESPLQNAAWIIFALALALPWMAMRLLGIHPPVVPEVVLSGLSIVGAAFILSWAAEVAQLEISQALAVVFLALVAVLPEYAVDLYYAWGAGHAMRGWDPSTPPPMEMGLPMANMTGSNRLLIGMGWTLVVFIHAWRTRSRELVLGPGIALDTTYLLVATLYSFIIPLKGSLSMFDCFVYVGLFVLYVRQAMRAPVEEPELEGPAVLVGRLPQKTRRAANLAMFAFACAAIYMAAEPFADGLKHIGRAYGIETFLLVQWLAPFASESPEFLVAALFAFRGEATMGLGALISSKVNQWTLLVGMIPLAVFAASGGHTALPLDDRQNEELLLTAAQSFFAVAVLGNLRVSALEAVALSVLFLAQLSVPTTWMRYAFSMGYIFLGVSVFGLAGSNRRDALRHLRTHLRW